MKKLIIKPQKVKLMPNHKKETTKAQSTQRKTLEEIFFELLCDLCAFVVKISLA
jgi:hypothetical protein